MELSLFLAKFLGLYLLILAVLFCFRREQLEMSLKEVFASPGMLLLAGLLSLSAGLLIVIAHPVWECNWRVLITIIGYIAIVKGIVRIGHPQIAKEMMGRIIKKCSHCRVVILLVVALFLIYHGFQ